MLGLVILMKIFYIYDGDHYGNKETMHIYSSD